MSTTLDHKEIARRALLRAEEMREEKKTAYRWCTRVGAISCLCVAAVAASSFFQSGLSPPLTAIEENPPPLAAAPTPATPANLTESEPEPGATPETGQKPLSVTIVPDLIP